MELIWYENLSTASIMLFMHLLQHFKMPGIHRNTLSNFYSTTTDVTVGREVKPEHV